MPDLDLTTTSLDFTRAVLASPLIGAIVLVCTRCGACVPTSEDESAAGAPSRVHHAFHAALDAAGEALHV